MQTFTVPAGREGWLSSIALRFYGQALRRDPARWARAYRLLATFNNLASEHEVFAGQVLAVPDTLAELERRVARGEVHLVEPPDPAASPDDPAAVALANAPTPGAAVQLPVPAGVRVVSGFGPRGVVGPYPPHFHRGVDLAGPGYPEWVQPAGIAGVVERAADAGDGYGRSVVVAAAAAGIRVLYAHLGDLRVRRGQAVGADTPLGEIGDTGKSAGEHLHLAVLPLSVAVIPGRAWAYSQEVDPAPYLQLCAVGGARGAA